MTAQTPVTRRRIMKGALAVPVVGLSLSRVPWLAQAQGEPVRVGSKDFPEQFLLSNMFGDLLENAGIPTNRDNINLGGTGIAHQALVEGEIDLYAEYTGTAFTNDAIFGQPFPPEGELPAATPATPMGTPAAGSEAFSALDLQIYEYCKQAYAELGLVMLDQTPFNDNQAIAVQRSFSEENGITTLSQLAEWGQDNEIVISAPVDFETRPDGLVGLQNVYDAGFENATVLGVDPGIKYDALNAGDANVVLAFGTDAEIQQFDLIVLQDDQGLFPPGHAAPVVRQAVIDVYPNIPDVLNAVIPLLTNEAQIGLNAAVVIDGGDPADVARQFLIDNGLISA